MRINYFTKQQNRAHEGLSCYKDNYTIKFGDTVNNFKFFSCKNSQSLTNIGARKGQWPAWPKDKIQISSIKSFIKQLKGSRSRSECDIETMHKRCFLQRHMGIQEGKKTLNESWSSLTRPTTLTYLKFQWTMFTIL